MDTDKDGAISKEESAQLASLAQAHEREADDVAKDAPRLRSVSSARELPDAVRRIAAESLACAGSRGA